MSVPRLNNIIWNSSHLERSNVGTRPWHLCNYPLSALRQNRLLHVLHENFWVSLIFDCKNHLLPHLSLWCKIYLSVSSVGAVLKICIKGQCACNTDPSSTYKITGRCMICFQVLSYLIGKFHLSHKTTFIWHLLWNKNSIKVLSNTKRTIFSKNM